ncbi:MAG: peptidyl-prolyl cis-trans isomerase [Proteobacteria bacterium]|nr:peptidyl-prolyl cis-trans isomerase [Pseudomonadota bacterium]
MRKILSISVCLALAACSGGSTGDQHIVQLPANLPVAETVNGTPVPQELVDAFVRVKAAKADMSNPEQRAEILRVLGDYVLLAEQAQRDKMLADPKFAAEVEVARLSALANGAMIRLQQQTPISDDALKAEYEAKVARMGKSEYDFGNLLFASEDEALKAAGELTTGKPFAQVYDEWKGKAAQSKVFSHIPAGQLPEPLAQALAQMKVGDFSRTPVKTQFGWHVFHLDAINPVTPPEFDKVKDEIRGALQKKIGEERLAKLKQQAKIEYPAGSAPTVVKPAPAPAQPAPAVAPEKKG